MNLALFDLDYTLIPFDGGRAWLDFLIERGVLSQSDGERYLAGCQRYVAGDADIHELHQLLIGPIAPHPPADRSQWSAEFEQAMKERIPTDSFALVQRHRSEGHVCSIVTATARLVAEPFARLF